MTTNTLTNLEKISTAWTKLKKESFGILQVYLRSGTIKYFVGNTRRKAMKEAKMWLFINKTV